MSEDQLKSVNVRKEDEGEDVEGHSHYGSHKAAPNKGSHKL